MSEGHAASLRQQCFFHKLTISASTVLPHHHTLPSTVQNSHFSLHLVDHGSPLSDLVSHLAAMAGAICAARMKLFSHRLPVFPIPEILGLHESGASLFWACCHQVCGFHILGQPYRQANLEDIMFYWQFLSYFQNIEIYLVVCNWFSLLTFLL